VQAQPFAADTSEAASRPVVFNQYYSTPFVMGEIYVEGNKHTKAYIIQRELPFKTATQFISPTWWMVLK